MVAAETISDILSRSYHRMFDLLLRSYQLIRSPWRSLIKSGAKFAIAAFMVAYCMTC